MNELFELAKMIDVIILFYIFMGAGIYGIVSAFIDVIRLIRNAWKRHKEKKTLKAEKKMTNNKL